jgi:hypothetical protein
MAGVIMALNRYIVTADVTVPAGTATPVSGGPGTVSWAGPAGAWAEGYPVTFTRGTPIVLDPAGPLYAAIGAGNLRAFADTDAVGHRALAN